MAETNTTTGGEATTNTTTSTTGGGTTGGRGTGNTVTNTSTTTRGGDAGSTTGMSSANTPDATLQSEENASRAIVSTEGLLPYPHAALTHAKVEASAHRDLIKNVYKEHEKALEAKHHDIQLSPEMLAARDDAQVRLADELRSSLAAQRSMAIRKVSSDEDTVTVKLTHPHTHAGVAYEAGDEIKVDEGSAKFIEEAKVGKIVDGESK